jgi:hypothetical protein
MSSQQYEAVRAHQVSLRREAEQDRLVRAASERSPPRRSALVSTGCSALARRFHRVPRTEWLPARSDGA